MGHELVERVCADLNRELAEIRQRRADTDVENGRRRAAYAQQLVRHDERINEAMAKGLPLPPPPEAPELVPDNTRYAEQQLLERRMVRLREHADEIEAAAEARETEILEDVAKVLAGFHPYVQELQDLLAGLREVRTAVDSSVPGVHPVNGRAARTPQWVTMDDLLAAAVHNAVVLAPIPAKQPVISPHSQVDRKVISREVRAMPEPPPPQPPGSTGEFGTRRAG